MWFYVLALKFRLAQCHVQMFQKRWWISKTHNQQNATIHCQKGWKYSLGPRFTQRSGSFLLKIVGFKSRDGQNGQSIVF